MIQSISKDQAYQNVQPLIKDLMKDDNQEVRKGGIEAATKFIEVLGADTITSLYPSLKACSEDAKWRVRLELMRNIIELAVKAQNNDLFTKYLEPLFINYLKDRVSAIRGVAIERIGDLARTYGVNWINSFLGKLSETISKEPCFHFKIAAVYSLKEICYSVHGESFVDKSINLIIQASREPVPNIREVCVKAERDIASRFEKGSIRDAIKKHIVSLN
jgi:serine/threonine-protein phosphatase 2A regulatory subunit A